MEVGDASESADPALFEKLPIFWNASGRPPLRALYRDLIKLRKQYTAFQNDTVVWLTNTAPAEVVSLLRKDEKDEFAVFINFSSRMVTGSVELPKAEEFAAQRIDGLPPRPQSALPEFQLGGFEWRIFHRALKQ
jgi:glycosidase